MSESVNPRWKARRSDWHAPGAVIAIASVIVSMALVAVGNGLMFAYIPVRLGAEGFAPTWAGRSSPACRPAASPAAS